jgi:hypothetical protein
MAAVSISDLSIPPPAGRDGALARARARLTTPVARRASVWPVLLAALIAACAALAAAAAVILGAPGIGAAADKAPPALSHPAP